ncbi:MAG TPA: hypothetical protein VN457_03130, partial [Chlamydiales bacterium]|nr:hypothetical protein [Chlamydiales bacterium]
SSSSSSSSQQNVRDVLYPASQIPLLFTMPAIQSLVDAAKTGAQDSDSVKECIRLMQLFTNQQISNLVRTRSQEVVSFSWLMHDLVVLQKVPAALYEKLMQSLYSMQLFPTTIPPRSTATILCGDGEKVGFCPEILTYLSSKESSQDSSHFDALFKKAKAACHNSPTATPEITVKASKEVVVAALSYLFVVGGPAIDINQQNDQWKNYVRQALACEPAYRIVSVARFFHEMGFTCHYKYLIFELKQRLLKNNTQDNQLLEKMQSFLKPLEDLEGWEYVELMMTALGQSVEIKFPYQRSARFKSVTIPLQATGLLQKDDAVHEVLRHHANGLDLNLSQFMDDNHSIAMEWLVTLDCLLKRDL